MGMSCTHILWFFSLAWALRDLWIKISARAATSKLSSESLSILNRNETELDSEWDYSNLTGVNASDLIQYISGLKYSHSRFLSHWVRLFLSHWCELGFTEQAFRHINDMWPPSFWILINIYLFENSCNVWYNYELPENYLMPYVRQVAVIYRIKPWLRNTIVWKKFLLPS